MGTCNSSQGPNDFAGDGAFLQPSATRQTKWMLEAGSIASTGTLSARNALAHLTDWPTTNSSAGQTVLNVLPCNALSLRFFAKDTSTPTPNINGKQVKVRLWGLTNLFTGTSSCDTLGDWLGDFTVTFGGAAVAGSFIFASTANSSWAKEIAITGDQSLFPGIRQVGRGLLGAEAVPSLVLDAMGYAGFVVQMEKVVSGDSLDFGFVHREF